MRVKVCQWRIPAEAFGAKAWFDFQKPERDVSNDSATPRRLHVRKAGYGAATSSIISFTFSRPTAGQDPGRWHVEFGTSLWSGNGGGSAEIKSLAPVELAKFVGSATPLLVHLPTNHVRSALNRIFEKRLSVATPAPKTFVVRLDKNLLWWIEGKDTIGLSAFSGQVLLKTFCFGWRRASDENDVVYFSGLGEAGFRPDHAVVLNVGDAKSHHLALRFPNEGPKAPARILEMRYGASPLDPAHRQTVVVFRLGQAELDVKQGVKRIAGPVPASDLVLTETGLPPDRCVARTVLWGGAFHVANMDVGTTDTKVKKPAEAGAKEASRSAGPIATAGARAIVSPVGRLRIGPPTRDELPKSQPDRQPTPARADGKPTISKASAGDRAPPAPQGNRAVERLFQIACGDQGGAREATVFVVHDTANAKTKPQGLRRVVIDLALLRASVGLEDVSFSTLTFQHSDFRLAYEDGRVMGELPAGEYPRGWPSSFVWVGPSTDHLPTDRIKAEFDLSRATLICARDYDLMKLQFRFQDLILTVTDRPTVRPARADCQIIEADDVAHDSRPILVAEFDPQHVFEEAVFRPDPPPLPDVDMSNAPPIVCDTFNDVPTQQAVVAHLCKLESPAERATFRDCVANAKVAEEQAVLKPTPGTKGPFEIFRDAYATSASGLDFPPDQKVYVGAFGFDPDAMALARKVQKTGLEAVLSATIWDMLARVEKTAKEKLKKYNDTYPIRPIGTQLSADKAFANALRRERLIEPQEPLYGLFRDFYREQVTKCWSFAQRNGAIEAAKKYKFEPPAALTDRVVEYLTEENRPDDIVKTDVEARLTAIVPGFVLLAMGKEDIPDLVGARLSGPSRLAFRINCQPVAGLDAEDAGLPGSSGDGPNRPGRAGVQFEAIPFTFEALTDWSRHEPAVTRRARKLFTALPSGLIPPLGNRAANLGDHDVLAFQGISKAPTTASERLAEVRAAIIVAPDAWETAIEIPARLVLSTAQDAIWLTDRRLPPDVVLAGPCGAGSRDGSDRPMLENGRDVAKPCDVTSTFRHDLWSARLAVADVSPSLRVVHSPDFRPMALTGEAKGAEQRLPGHSAPPRGPLAPWLIGDEQLESRTLEAGDFAKDDAAPCDARQPDKRFPLIRWLCDRFATRKSITDDYAYFRTTLDANDRHQLVLLSSAYGLPVIGRRNAVGEDATVGGALIEESGQIEPGEDFTILDASNDQAIYRPIPLDVRELSLTALGGSFWHDTMFKPAAGADDYWGRKIFDGFAIERWQQDIVLGRDIRGEVVYKGYLFPLGHRASLVKLTERIFLRTQAQGVKAILRQRLFLRVGTPRKRYPAVGQPHRGRLWCAGTVTLLTTHTPDIIDPTMPLGPDPAIGRVGNNGRIGLENAPGLAFWPRIDITERGLLRFEFTLDASFTALPLIFVDNIAATNPESLRIVNDHYEAQNPAWRTMVLGGQKVRYAPESQSGDTVFATDGILVGAHGRLANAGSTWASDLSEFKTTGVLEGAEQPPFYPRMNHATLRLAQVERFSGNAAAAVDVQYDGHFVRHGFSARTTSTVGEAAADNRNPLEIFLNMRTVVKLDMGDSGDRAAGIGRPNSKIVALSRAKGPLGGDDRIAYQLLPTNDPLQGPAQPGFTVDIGGEHSVCDASPKCRTLPPDCPAPLAIPSVKPLLCEETWLGLVSLAAHFDPKHSQASAAPPPTMGGGLVTVVGSDSAPGASNAIADAERVISILQGAFSGDAKILGTIRIKDLLRLLNLPTPAEAMPALQETIEYGTAALRQTGDAAAVLANDVRTRVLSPLREVVARLRAEWLALDEKLNAKQLALGPVDGKQPVGLSLDTVYPEIGQGLRQLEEALTTALAEQNPLALAPKLAAVFEAGRRFVQVLAQVAANPVERLQDAVGAAFQQLLSAFSSDLDKLREFLKFIEAQLRFLKGDPAPVKKAIVDWVAATISESIFTEQLSIAIKPIAALPIAENAFPSLNTDIKTKLSKIDSDLAKALEIKPKDILEEGLSVLLQGIADGKSDGDVVLEAAKDAVKTVVTRKRSDFEKAIKDARAAVAAIVDGGKAEVVALKATLEAELDAYLNYLVEQFFEKLKDVVRDNLPAELAVLLASLDRALVIVAQIKAVRAAIERRQPKEALAALSAFSIGVFGYDPAVLVGEGVEKVQRLKSELEAIQQTVQTKIKDIVATNLPDLVPSAADLGEEIKACVAYKKKPDDESLLPVAKPASKLTETIKDMILAVDGLWKDNISKSSKLLIDKKPDIIPHIGATYDELKEFDKRTVLLIGDDTLPEGSLRRELRLLYCEAVDLEVAFVALGAALIGGVSLDDPGTISDLSRLTHRLTQAAVAVAARIGAIVTLLADYLAEPANTQFLVAGALAGASGWLIGQLSVPAEVKDAFAKLMPPADAEAKLAGGLAATIMITLNAVRASALFGADLLTTLNELLTQAQTVLDKAGLSLRPQSERFIAAVTGVKSVLDELARFDTTDLDAVKTIAAIPGTVIAKDPAGPTTTVKDLVENRAARLGLLGSRLREAEARAMATWRAFEQRLQGLPNELGDKVWTAIAQTTAIKTLADGYGSLIEAREKAIKAADSVPLLSRLVREALIVPSAYYLPAPWELGNPPKLAGCDRLEEERQVLRGAQSASTLPSDLKRLLASWTNGSAAPLVISTKVRDIATEAIRGDVLSVIDIGAFRDEIENALTDLIPTRATLNYDFRSFIKDKSKPNAIFQPKRGEPFGIQVRTVVDLLNPKSVDFRARGYLGAFDINLVGGIVDALTLKFGGAAFTIEGGAKPRFDITYEDFVIGKDLEFAKQLQDYLLPKDGSGVFLQPLTRTVGIEAGYGINLGTIGLGAVSFFNVSLNVSAELPFSDQDALFKVSLGRRLSPFTMSILPFAGAGYFSIFAAADGVRGFEASFEFGGGGSLGFGPLTAQARIMVGVFVRVLEVKKGVRTTELYGTFFAGGSASIWIFHFATSLYVRLGSSDGGAMYGEAIFSFSFSLGIVDYDYSVTVFKEEEALGNSSSQTGSGQGGGTGILDVPTRYTALGPETDRRRAKPGSGGATRVACQAEDWSTYVNYFDLSLMDACEAA